ncbi:MAG: tRNA epoxyqueuosine(34) reductase QueG [Comamonadaceae bacterium]|nr:tRNA epoxyqueuosine(34) reductase QueG [Burkholderiales bacterium]MEB2348211.1 tRNA epoxyqueuosine(34) reductase QueG [Comamonadaceae bacterium]
MVDGRLLLAQVRAWARELGFSQIGVAGVDLSSAEPRLLAWLAAGYHGNLHYMERHGLRRARPAELIPGTVSVITARMPYLARDTPDDWRELERARLSRPGEGVVSLYARGRDYHKVVRARLQKLCDRIQEAIGPFGHRVFSDSAPVLEKELAGRSGQGWRGKHSLVLSRDAGSMFFLGEIYVDFALAPTEPVTDHCGTCTACIDVCPTQAIVATGVVDARRCISYLTIENHEAMPEELRPQVGNHVYGCDDCQTICPWNKYAQKSSLLDFDERTPLAGQQLVDLFAWDEATFLKYTEGGPIRRINHERWLRNVAVALGNALRVAHGEEADAIRAALRARLDHPSALVREHVAWALAQEGSWTPSD